MHCCIYTFVKPSKFISKNAAKKPGSSLAKKPGSSLALQHALRHQQQTQDASTSRRGSALGKILESSHWRGFSVDFCKTSCKIHLTKPRTPITSQLGLQANIHAPCSLLPALCGLNLSQRSHFRPHTLTANPHPTSHLALSAAVQHMTKTPLYP